MNIIKINKLLYFKSLDISFHVLIIFNHRADYRNNLISKLYIVHWYLTIKAIHIEIKDLFCNKYVLSIPYFHIKYLIF